MSEAFANTNETPTGYREQRAEAMAAARTIIEEDFSARVDAIEMPTTFVCSNGESVDCACEEEALFALQQEKVRLAEEIQAEAEGHAAMVAEAFLNRERAKLEEMKTDLQYKSMTGQLAVAA